MNGGKYETEKRLEEDGHEIPGSRYSYRSVMAAIRYKCRSLGRTSDSYTANGTFHIDQFGEYDINAEVTVTDGVITAVEITGDNFGGTYGDYNQNVKLPAAIAGMAEKFIGLGDTDREGIQGWMLYQGPPTLPTGSKKRL